MKTLQGNLFDYAKNGYIVHQVNCQNSMRSGFAGEFLRRYPLIKEEYHKEIQKFSEEGRSIVNHLQYVQLNNDLIGVNSYTQEYYGNAYKNNVKYTDEEALIRNIEKVLLKAKQESANVYIPENIGCGLGGGDWGKVLEALYLMDTSHLYIVSRGN